MGLSVLSLNAWGGKRSFELGQYIRNGEHDVYCFQEVFSAPFLASCPNQTKQVTQLALFTYLARCLPNHTGIFSASSDSMGIDRGGEFTEQDSSEPPCSIGTAIFVSKNLLIEASGDIFVYGNRNSRFLKLTPYSPKTLQYAVVIKDGQRYNIFNFHGLWNGGGKKDCPERLEQSRNIKAFLDNFSERKILCGDFNLDPETESIKILEGEGTLINLIHKFGITSTRTELYRSFKTGSLFADYFFVSPDIFVERFDVDQSKFTQQPSDHAPLRLWCK